MTVHIMIGAPGSGKSKLAKEVGADLHFIVSADDYFYIRVEAVGIEFKHEYRFDASKLGEAHSWCLKKFNRIISNPNFTEDLVVDNTNSSLVEIAPYYALARAYGHKVIFHRFMANRHELEHVYFPRNVHGVSLKTVMAIGQRVWDLMFPKFWEFELVDHDMTRFPRELEPSITKD